MKPLDDLTAQCIRCGFCLESCPTFLETGNEAMSPRGRIHLAKLADRKEILWTDADLQGSLDSCVGCRACETACPSGVEYGQILEMARERIPKKRARGWVLGSMTGGLIGSPLGQLASGRRVPSVVSRAVSGREAEVDVPRPIERPWTSLPSDLPAIRGEVYLLEGCVVGGMFPSVAEATRRVLRRAGYRVRMVSGCCGALHAHAGMSEEARERESRLDMTDDLPVVMNSAGCGSHLKDRGWERVRDVTEFLVEAGFEEALRESAGLPVRATYHDACHLVHGQRVGSPPRRLLEAVPGLELIPLREADLCCGSGGVYNLFQPEMARRLVERKWSNIEATEAEIVVMGNPGCQAWIGQAAREHGGGVQVMHTVELLEASFSGLPAN